MSIFIHIGTSSGALAPAPACIVETETTDMGPGVQSESEISVAPAVEEAMVSVAPVITVGRIKETKSNNSYHGYPNCFGLPYQDHNYGAPPPPTPPMSPKTNGNVDDDTNFSVISTTSTNNEEERHVEKSVTRCICGYDHDDEFMICCDKCFVWQHVDCMGLDRSNMPESYLCERCSPRKVDRQKAKALQTKKKEEMSDTSSDETDDDPLKSAAHGGNDVNGTHRKRRKTKRRKSETQADKNERHMTKRLKKIQTRKDARKSKVPRRTKSKSESSTTIDEEAQDAWEYNVLEWVDKYEEAVTNHYTAEIQLLTRSIKLNGQHDNLLRKVSELSPHSCKVVDIGHNCRSLVASEDIGKDQAIAEYRGKLLLASQFMDRNTIFGKKCFPFVLFYKPNPNEEAVCVDAREYGSKARFSRRSCMPNAMVHHVIQNASLHLYLFACKEIKRDEEITIAFDSTYKDCINNFECACENEFCLVSGNHLRHSSKDYRSRRRGRKSISITEDDASQSSLVPNQKSPVKHEKPEQHDSSELSTTVTSEGNGDISGGHDDMETEEQALERRKKMTREERKLDAIMRAFEKMEKMAKRRQQALERMAHTRAQQQHKSENEKLPEEEGNSQSSLVAEVEDAQPDSDLKEMPISSQQNSVSSSNQRQKKGKKRRGSGTSSRKRVRSSSGGSDILSPDEMASCCTPTPQAPNLPTPLSPQTVVTTESPVTNPAPASVAPGECVFPKSKRFLMHEWLQEKAETVVPLSCPLSIRTGGWQTATPTCYVRCTKDLSNNTGISAAFLRRNSASSGSGPRTPLSIGSAKKRWLKQAMFEKSDSTFGPEIMEAEQCSPLQNGCLSPDVPCENGSPSTISPPEDIVTPLKKRRLMRESVDSASPSLLSPSSIATNERPASTSSAGSPDDPPLMRESLMMPHFGVKRLTLEDLSNDSEDAEMCQITGTEKELHLESPIKEAEPLVTEKSSPVEATVLPSSESSCEQSEPICELQNGDDTEVSTTPICETKEAESALDSISCSSTTTTTTENVDQKCAFDDTTPQTEPDSSSAKVVESEPEASKTLSEADTSAATEPCSFTWPEPVTSSTTDCNSSFPSVNRHGSTHPERNNSPCASHQTFFADDIGSSVTVPLDVVFASPVKDSTGTVVTEMPLVCAPLSASVVSSSTTSPSGQKRKVSLSEYRMRMKENAGKTSSITSDSCESPCKEQQAIPKSAELNSSFIPSYSMPSLLDIKKQTSSQVLMQGKGQDGVSTMKVNADTSLPFPTLTVPVGISSTSAPAFPSSAFIAQVTPSYACSQPLPPRQLSSPQLQAGQPIPVLCSPNPPLPHMTALIGPRSHISFLPQNSTHLPPPPPPPRPQNFTLQTTGTFSTLVQNFSPPRPAVQQAAATPTPNYAQHNPSGYK